VAHCQYDITLFGTFLAVHEVLTQYLSPF